MKILQTTKIIMAELKALDHRLVQSPSGSCYIHLTGLKIKVVLIAYHTGHVPKKGVWQLRNDVSSSRKGSNRIYNDLSRLLNDFKLLVDNAK